MGLKLERSQTGIASEFYVAGELSRRGYDVTVTFGNTKAIDLIIHRGTNLFKVQVKGIQTNASICWNIDKTKITPDVYFVLINLHVDKPKLKPEFFVMTGSEALTVFKDTPKMGERRAYLDYKALKRMVIYQDRWTVFGEPQEVVEI